MTRTNVTIIAKQYLSNEDYETIKRLEETCYRYDGTNLKLELDYKIGISKNKGKNGSEINEILCYVKDSLIGYLGISSFGGSGVGEINGMVHPAYRRQGIFRQLFERAITEAQKQKLHKLLLLSDGKSKSGQAFLQVVEGKYAFSEYRMKCVLQKAPEENGIIQLRKAPIDEDDPTTMRYKVEHGGEVIGKLNIEYFVNTAFISGVQILPAYRGMGYGRGALKAALFKISQEGIYEIELDVECKNHVALNLYKDLGFMEQSVMDYFDYKI